MAQKTQTPTPQPTPYELLARDYPDWKVVIDGMINRREVVSDGAVTVITDNWRTRMDSLVDGLETIKTVLTGAAYSAARAGITSAIKDLLASAQADVALFEEKVNSLSAQFNSLVDKIRADLELRTDCSVEGPLNAELVNTLRQIRESRADLQVLKSYYAILVEGAK